ncbi:MAG: ATP-dependent RecD-like DNA helicase [Clostridia bacterium]|nr:ATP-dependent RecD-like DNA helicase [Clostridia bacterium]
MLNDENISEINGTVEAITFHNEANGFTILEFSTEEELVTVVGTFLNVFVGEEMTVYGNWVYHQSFGRQFKASSCERRLPNSAAAFLRYLSGGAIKGIGPSTAVKIVEKFGDKTFDVLENEPLKLTAIKGISMAKAVQFSDEFKKQFAIRETILSLGAFGLTSEECIKVYKKFGGQSFSAVSENPYVLCREGINLGFVRVDEIANKINPSSPQSHRLNAGIIFVIRHNLGNGHTCIPRNKLTTPCANLLAVDAETIEIEIDNMIDAKELVCVKVKDKEYIYLPSTYNAEMAAAQRIKILQKFPPICANAPESEIELAEENLGIKYEEMQKIAISEALQRGMFILTGGPGTGKTTTLNAIIWIMERQGLHVTLTAPTGRAAKRMSEVTGKEAKTVHRLLEASFTPDEQHTFARNEQHPLDTDVVIIDEISMVDIYLFDSLLAALPFGCRIIMVGDSNQLPSVGPGNVLEDLITTEKIPVVKLNEIFRQSGNSMIVNNAHKIINGQAPELRRKDGDFFHLERPNPHDVASLVQSLYAERLPKTYGYSPLFDIQVLCPSKKGNLGTINLNRVLQEKLNPHDFSKQELNLNGRILRIGDKVIQTTNNYDIIWKKDDKTEGTGVFNGDIGIITEINHRESVISVRYDDRIAAHPFETAAKLDLAYAITIHKSQGSEFEAVIIPTLFVPPQLCYRNLFYTAVTRAKKLLITIGTVQTIEEMTKNNNKAKRCSCLKYFLKDT